MENMSNDLLRFNDYGFSIENLEYKGRVDMVYDNYHKHFEILYVLNSSRKLFIGKNDYILTNNTIAFLPPYSIHHTVSLDDCVQNRFLINMSEEFFEQIKLVTDENLLLCFTQNPPILVLTDEQKEEILKLFNAMLDCYSNLNQPYNSTQLKAHLIRFLSLCAAYALKNNSYLGNTPKYNYNIIDIVKYVEQKYNEKITLDQLSRNFFMSKFEISRKFKLYTGISLIKFINNIRVIHAQNMLEQNCHSITAVSATTGFDNLTYFGRVFKEITNMSPREYRQKYAKPSDA